MDAHMSPDRIANSIMQDKSFLGHYVLLEGKKDVKLYRRLIQSANAKVKVTFGKYQLREVYKILDEREFDKKIGIRDSDFLRVPDNPKFSTQFSDAIFPTDCHDAEIMAIEMGALDDLLHVVIEEDKVKEFEKKLNKTLPNLLIELLYPLGCLKLANKRYGLGLCFKPEKPEGNPIKYKKFICDKNWVFLGNDQLIQAVIEYSVNRSTEIASVDEITKRLNEIIIKNYDQKEIVHGHDSTELLHMIFRDGLKTKNKIIQNADCIESLLYSCLDLLKFMNTNIYASIGTWQKTNSAQIFKNG